MKKRVKAAFYTKGNFGRGIRGFEDRVDLSYDPVRLDEELEMKKIDMIVFSSDYFDRSKVDPDLKSEYDAVRSTGLYRVAIFSYPSWFDQEKLILNEEPEEEVTAVYRGWMMKPEMYQAFHQQLIAHKIRLITTPEQYEKMHVFPNVYEDVKDDTAKMEIFPLHEQIDVEQLKKAFSRFMVKDYVKSVKGTEFPKFFDQSVRQEEFDHWMEVFYKYRGDLLTGGICIKEYLDLKRYGEQTSEFRVFYINHEIATICRNSAQADYVPQPPKELIEKYQNLASLFYTVDYAELEDGSWKIIEAGDGSVSGLSEGQDYEHFFRTLYHCFE